MEAQKHHPDMDMDDDMIKAFNKWSLEEFSKQPAERKLNSARGAVRARFNLEK